MPWLKVIKDNMNNPVLQGGGKRNEINKSFSMTENKI
jgi:hypothetical protein